MTALTGLAGGVAANVGAQFNSTWGPAAGMAAVGFIGKNETLLTLAGMQFSNMIPLGQSGGNSGGGWY